MRRFLPIFCLLPLLGTLLACGSTQVTTTWRSQDPLPQRPFTKVLALVINATPGERRAGEDALAAAIPNAQGIPAYTIISDDEVLDRATIRRLLLEKGIDGAAVLRLVSSDQRTVTHTRPESSTTAGLYEGYRSYPLYRTSYTVTDTYVHAEVSIFAVKEDALVWSGQSTTTNPAGVRELVADVSKATIAELRRVGILR